VNISWFLAKRIAIPKHKTFSRFIVRLCVIATAISVAVMVMSTALFDGFEQAITNKFLNSWGNLQVMNYDASGASFQQQSPLLLDSTLMRQLSSIENVKTVSPYAIQNTVFKTKSDIQGALLKGVDAQFDWQRVQQFMIAGKKITYNDSGYSKQIIISNYQSEKLNVHVGDSLVAYFIQDQSDVPRARKLEVCGIYETGLMENDKLFAYADIALVHRIKSDSLGSIFGYEITLHDAAKSKDVQQQMQSTCVTAPLEAYTIQERFSYIFQWLGLIKSDLSIIYIIMLIVAVMNIISGILILILERTQMIGVLKSVGASNKSIQQVFFWQSLYICIVGITAGIVLAVGLCLWQKYFPFIKLDPKVYYVNYVQVHLQATKIASIAVGTLLVCALLLLLPTYLVNKINPIKALRFD
jgi:lipoprotein-releasing system permease protein